MRTLIAAILCLFMGFLGGYYVGNGQIDTASTRKITPALDKAGADAQEYMKSTDKTITREVNK